MQAFFLNKRNAVILTAVIVVISIFSGAVRSLNKMRNDAVLTFENGALRDGVSVANDIKRRANLAWDMALIAEKYIGETDTTKKMKEFIDKFEKEKDIANKFKISSDIAKAASELYSAIDKQILTDELHLKKWSDIYTELAKENTIKNDKYNNEAFVFNQKLNKLPARLIKRLGLIEELPVY